MDGSSRMYIEPVRLLPEGADDADALALTAAEGVGRTVQGQIGQPHVVDVVQAVPYLFQSPGCDLLLVGQKLQRVEEGNQVLDAHGHELVDVAPADTHVQGLPAQPAAFTLAAYGLAGVAADHVFVLYLVPLGFQLFEEGIDAGDVLVAVPKLAFLLGREVFVGGMHREAEFVRIGQYLLLEIFHHLALPAGHGVLIDRKRLIGDDQRLVDADDLAEAAADGGRLPPGCCS